ncbi:hypothetical protein Ancab_015806 [Ancistrocladus abbreviatus]
MLCHVSIEKVRFFGLLQIESPSVIVQCTRMQGLGILLANYVRWEHKQHLMEVLRQGVHQPIDPILPEVSSRHNLGIPSLNVNSKSTQLLVGPCSLSYIASEVMVYRIGD